jgi:hypothetical protein
MRGWCSVNPWHRPVDIDREDQPARAKVEAGSAKPIRREVNGIDTLELIQRELPFPCEPTGTTAEERWALLEPGFPLKAMACEIFLTRNTLQDIKDE